MPGLLEPNAGSDLANLQTRAVLDGDRYVMNGQKVWTSMAHVAEGLLPGPHGPGRAKHKGITFLLVDMKTPGSPSGPCARSPARPSSTRCSSKRARARVERGGQGQPGLDVGMTTLATSATCSP